MFSSLLSSGYYNWYSRLCFIYFHLSSSDWGRTRNSHLLGSLSKSTENWNPLLADLAHAVYRCRCGFSDHRIILAQSSAVYSPWHPVGDDDPAADFRLCPVFNIKLLFKYQKRFRQRFSSWRRQFIPFHSGLFLILDTGFAAPVLDLWFSPLYGSISADLVLPVGLSQSSFTEVSLYTTLRVLNSFFSGFFDPPIWHAFFAEKVHPAQGCTHSYGNTLADFATNLVTLGLPALCYCFLM